MLFDGISYFNINNDKFFPVNRNKPINNSENEASGPDKIPVQKLNATGKCIDLPVNDTNLIDRGFSKCSPVDPALFHDFFAHYDVAEAKELVKGIVNISDRDKFVEKVKDFYSVINKMDRHELIETAEFLGDQMSHTEGRDDVLGSLLMGVLGEINSRDNLPIYIKDPFKMHKFPVVSPDDMYHENTAQELKLLNF